MCWLALLGVAAAPMPRVRSTNPVIAAAIAEAKSRSETFRSLVRTIEGTDGIVYVEPGRCRHGVPACLSLFVVAGDGYRLLRILVERAGDARSLMALLGHELRHAIELLVEPSVRSMAAAYSYYAREFPTAGGVFETPAAIEAGIAVARDLENAANLVRVANHPR